MAPEERLRVGSCDLLILGTIAGFVPDGERVRTAVAQHAPQAIALGVPREDLEVLDGLASAEKPELVEPDALTQRFLDLLGLFGQTRLPSPDLEAAHLAAREHNLPLLAVDLDDEAHSELYTKLVRFGHVLLSNRRYKRLLKRGLDARPADAYALAVAWDTATLATASLREVEAQRAAHMAKRLGELAKVHTRVLAVLPVARLAAVVSLMRAKP